MRCPGIGMLKRMAKFIQMQGGTIILDAPVESIDMER